VSSKCLLVVTTLLSAAALVHCSSSRDPLVSLPTEDDGGATEDSAIPDVLEDAATDSSISDGRLDDEYEIPDGAVTCSAKPCAVALTAVGTASSTAFCALLEGGAVDCWGSNAMGLAGFPMADGTFSTAPRRIDGVPEATKVTLGGSNGCLIAAGGGVWCWGAALLVNAGRSPEAGPPFVGAALPAQLDLVPPAANIAIGPSANARFPGSACITTVGGAVHCWGNNDSSQLGPRPIANTAPPDVVQLGSFTATSVSTAGRRTFVITPAGELLSWGMTTCNSGTCRFLLGRDTSEDIAPSPALVPDLTGVRVVASGANHSCAIAGRFVECWGTNRQGELGLGNTSEISWLPQPTILAAVAAEDDVDAGVAPSDDIPLHVGANDLTTCAVMGSGRVYCWGNTEPAESRGRPQRVRGLSGPAVAVGVGRLTSCALLRTGAVECWGSNQFGALGRGVDDEALFDPKPAPVVFPDELHDE